MTNFKNVQVDILQFNEDGLFYNYCPALHLTGYGKTLLASTQSFDIVFQEYIVYTVENLTFLADIKSLNWQSTRTEYLIPTLSQLSHIDENLKRILDELEFIKITASLDLPDVTKELCIKPIIYGILDSPQRYGVQAWAINGQTGDIISQHFCSSEGFAKSDLGFTGPLFNKAAFSDDSHSTVSFNSERLEKYSVLYPDGFDLIWIGSWQNNEIIKNIIQLHGKKF